MIGIYKIVNMNNGKVYVGQSNDIEKRRLQHFTALDAGKHENKTMQTDYNRSREKWVFAILEECPLSLLNVREKYWIDYYHSADPVHGYNLTKGGGSRKRRFKGRPTSLLDELTG